MEDYISVGIIVIWAVYFVGKSFWPKKGGGSCACGDGCRKCGSGVNTQPLDGLQSEPDTWKHDTQWNYKM